MIPNKHFYMIRHGETEGNVTRICTGNTETPLTAKGRAEAAAVINIVDALAVKPTVIFHSQLSRARDTATILNQNLRLPMHEDARLSERSFGDWHGITYDELRRHMDAHHEPPNGETREIFRQRVGEGIADILTQSAAPVLIVCHEQVFRAFGEIYNITLRGVKNCQLYEFVPQAGAAVFPWKIVKHGVLE